MEKTMLDTPVPDGDFMRLGFTPNHRVVYKDEIVTNMEGGGFKKIPIEGLTKEDAELNTAWNLMVDRNNKGEYQTGEVTNRIAEMRTARALEAQAAELAAQEVVVTPVEAATAEDLDTKVNIN